MNGRWADAAQRVAGRWMVAVLAVVVLASCKREESHAPREVTFAVAASLRGVMPTLAAEYEREHPRVKILATYGASGDLRRQVEGGAPVDGVLFASDVPVDSLVDEGLVVAESRAVVATNALVLIGPKGGAAWTFETLDTLPDGAKLAIGEPGAVPAGQYAKRALEALGKWDALADNLVFGGDVSAVLAYARRGEVTAAIVYQTETRNIDDIAILDEASGGWAPRALVVAGVVEGAPNAAQAANLIDMLAEPEGQAILAQFGFGPAAP